MQIIFILFCAKKHPSIYRSVLYNITNISNERGLIICVGVDLHQATMNLLTCALLQHVKYGRGKNYRLIVKETATILMLFV